MYGTELIRRAKLLLLPSLCFAPWPPRDVRLPRLTGMNDPVESLLVKLIVEEVVPDLTGKLLMEFPLPGLFLAFVRFPKELAEWLDRLRVNLRFLALAAPAVRLVRREGM